ncbi:MAG: lamin tail domain-containing protein [Oscillospiraceae bacterium]|nr:lamin tail domain-containing protein [Oscillospiraceae bacterium]
MKRTLMLFLAMLLVFCIAGCTGGSNDPEEAGASDISGVSGVETESISSGTDSDDGTSLPDSESQADSFVQIDQPGSSETADILSETSDNSTHDSQNPSSSADKKSSAASKSTASKKSVSQKSRAAQSKTSVSSQSSSRSGSEISESDLKSGVIIYEIYTSGGYISKGGNNAPYQNNYVVLYNTNNQAVNLNGWFLLIADPKNANILTRQTVALSGSIAAKKYFVIQGGQGPGAPKNPAGSKLPFNVNITSTFTTLQRKNAIIALSTRNRTSGKVLPADDGISDYVGYGSSVHFEGAGPAKDISVQKILRRESHTDTNNNRVDFDAKNILKTPSLVVLY